MTAARWERLLDRLATTGIEAHLTVRTSRNGTSQSIILRPAGAKGTVEVHDRWWRKNPDIWIGWEAYYQRDSGITDAVFPITKRSGDVVDNVCALLVRLEADAAAA